MNTNFDDFQKELQSESSTTNTFIVGSTFDTQICKQKKMMLSYEKTNFFECTKYKYIANKIVGGGSFGVVYKA